MINLLCRGIPLRQRDAEILDSNDILSVYKGRYVYGSLVTKGDRSFICISTIYSPDSLLNNSICTMIEVRPDSVCRIAPVKDCDGNALFEGDLVSIDFGGSSEAGQIIFDENTFGWSIDFFNMKQPICEFTQGDIKLADLNNTSISHLASVSIDEYIAKFDIEQISTSLNLLEEN